MAPHSLTSLPAFRSGFERRIWESLHKAGHTATYETLTVSYVMPHTYTPDFVLPNGVVCELTGYFPAAKRAKLLAVRQANPALDLRVVFQKAATRISKVSRTTYGAWATHHKFTWCEGMIPSAWWEPIR